MQKKLDFRRKVIIFIVSFSTFRISRKTESLMPEMLKSGSLIGEPLTLTKREANLLAKSDYRFSKKYSKK